MSESARDEAIRIVREAVRRDFTINLVTLGVRLSWEEVERLIALARQRPARAIEQAVRAEYEAEAQRWVDEMKLKLGMTSAAPSESDAMDAARWRMLPAFLEKYQIEYVGLIRDIDAALAEQEKKG